MTNTVAAENLRGRVEKDRVEKDRVEKDRIEKDRVEKDKEKVEKRRALGRGLESLLPGPRAVPGAAVRPAGGAAISRRDPNTTAAEPHSAGVRSAEAHSVQPRSVQSHSVQSHSVQPRSTGQPGAAVPAQVIGEAIPGTIRAIAEEELTEEERAGISARDAEEAELRSAGQPRAAVPTQSFATHPTHPTQSFPTPPTQGFPIHPTQAPPTYPAQSFPSDETAPSGSDEVETITIYAQAESRMPGNLVVNIAITDIDKNPFQTRYVEDDEKLEELADSIKANGVVQPIMVRPGDEEGRYILILGERRLHASKKAGKTHIPALVRRVSLQQAAEMTIIENLQREDLSALEQAESFRVLSNEFHLTQQEIGERVGLSRVSVANYMRLLKLPRDVMQLLAEKKINFAQAKELLKLEGDDKIAEAALFAVKKGMTLEQVEMLVLRMNGLLDPIPGMPGQVAKKSGARWVDPNVRSAQMELERMLGVRVRIRDRKGKGKIVIEYHTVDDYERVVEMLRGRK